MSPLILILAAIAGCVSATTIRHYTGGNTVEDMLEHQDSNEIPSLPEDGSNEIPKLPEDNIDVEMTNETYIPINPCWEYYSCISNTGDSAPPGSLRKGYFITPMYMKKQCRNAKRTLTCYFVGDYSDCPGVEESFNTLQSIYDFMCKELNSSDVMSSLECANIYDVQQFVYMAIVKFESAYGTITKWPNANPSDISYMTCRAVQNYKTETGDLIESRCSEHVREIYDTVIDLSTHPLTEMFNCTQQDNNYGQ